MRARCRTPAAAAAALAVAAALAAAPARAGLFDDEEARRAIVDLRARVQAIDDAQRARVVDLERQLAQANAQSAQSLARANAQLVDEVQQLRRTVLELTGQLDALRAEQARLRGADEEMLRAIAEVQRQGRDVQAAQAAQALAQASAQRAAEERLRAFEPQKVTLDGREFTVDPQERRAYDGAIAQLRAGDFERASASLAAFGQRWPGSGYGDAARFWLGNAQYALKAYKEAIATFRQFVATAPEHPRVPEALLAIANSQIEAKDRAGARRTLDELVKTHPTSEAAQAARERLTTLKG